MRKSIILLCLVSVFLLHVECAKKKNQPPSAVSLIYPSDNLLCINNFIDFNWSDSTDPEGEDVTYNLVIARDRALTNIVENRTLTSSQVTISMEKSQAYYWRVVALDVNGNMSQESSINAFFTKGDGVLNNAPFSAALVSPANQGSVNAGSVSLTWNGADPDTSDTLTYEVFFGETNNPTSVANNVTTGSYSVTVQSGKTYYWKINTTDNSGAKSIGQIWSFTVN